MKVRAARYHSDTRVRLTLRVREAFALVVYLEAVDVALRMQKQRAAKVALGQEPSFTGRGAHCREHEGTADGE